MPFELKKKNDQLVYFVISVTFFFTCLITELDYCGLERCKSLDEGEFDCSWQNLSHSFNLGGLTLISTCFLNM